MTNSCRAGLQFCRPERSATRPGHPWKELAILGSLKVVGPYDYSSPLARQCWHVTPVAVPSAPPAIVGSGWAGMAQDGGRAAHAECMQAPHAYRSPLVFVAKVWFRLAAVAVGKVTICPKWS